MNATVKSERRFHDSWAFYLYALLYTILSTVLFMYKAPSSSITSSVESMHLREVLLFNVAFLIAMLSAFLVMCYFVPKLMIYLSVVMLPALSIIAFIKAPEKAAVGIILGIINIVVLLTVVFQIIGHIDYISKMISVSAGIFFSGMFGVLMVFLFTTTLLVIQLVPAVMVDTTNDIVSYLRYSIVLLESWTILISHYFNHVYMASMVFNIISGERDAASTSLSNSFYALGSISYGALLLAMITTIKAILSDSSRIASERNRERASRSLFKSIMLAISQAILNILGDAVRFANSFAFPYLSIHGTEYEVSVSKSFHLITSSDMRPITSFSGASFLVTFITMIFMLSNGYMNFELFSSLGLSFDNKSNIIYMGVVSLLFSAVFANIFFLIKSAVLAVVFTAISAPEATAKFDPELIEILNHKRNEMVRMENPK